MNQDNKNQVNSNSFSMDLESLRQKYSNLLIQYKAAVADYVNYLNQNSQQPYENSGNSYIILGVGTDGRLYSRPGLDAPWSLVDDNSNTGVITIFTGNDGKTIYCTNKNKEITYKSSWDAPTWQGPISDSCCVFSMCLCANRLNSCFILLPKFTMSHFRIISSPTSLCVKRFNISSIDKSCVYGLIFI